MTVNRINDKWGFACGFLAGKEILAGGEINCNTVEFGEEIRLNNFDLERFIFDNFSLRGCPIDDLNKLQMDFLKATVWKKVK